MSEALLPCESCHRHVRASARSCPFCDASTASAAANLARALCVGAALAAVAAAPSEALAQSPRELLAQAPAAAYGGPPMRDPLGPGEFERHAPPVTPVPPATPATTVRVRGLELRGPVSEPAARRALMRAWPMLQRCAAIARREGGGEIHASVRVSPSGRVVGASLDGASPAVQSCVLPALRRMVLGPGRGPVSVDVTVAVGGVGGDPSPPSRCAGPNPAGCRATGCGGGMYCELRAACRPSSCACTPQGWVCTSDCGGGECRPARRPLRPPL